jgi:ATP-dependent Clp protease protease subunit
MLINKHIGMDSDYTDEDGNLIKGEGMGIDGSIFQAELLQLDSMGKKRIQVWINSPGGVVTDGYDIYSTILKTKTPVDTYCVGTAASIAGVIFQAGRKRIMTDYSWLMYHNPFGGDNNDTIKTMTDSIITMISERCKMTTEEVKSMMDRTTYILADEAKIMNLCDEVERSSESNTKYLKKISNSLVFHKECNKILNFILINQNPTEMIKVTMKLGLNEGTPENAIVDAITAIQNKADKAELELQEVKNKAKEKEQADESEMDKLKAKIAKMEADKAKNDSELEDCKAKLAAVEKDKLKAEEDAKDALAEDKIKNFAKIGRIKNEEAVILQWKLTAKKIGLEEVTNMIESLPLNKEAAIVPTEIKEALTGKVTTASLAAQNRIKLLNKNK